MEGRGEMSLVSCLLTADRGYCLPNFADVFREFGLSVLLISPEQGKKTNPFVAASALKPPKDDDELGDDHLDSTSIDNEAQQHQLHAYKLDRRSEFVIPDGYDEGFAVFHAKFSHASVKCDYRACAVRESGTCKESKVIRFSYMIPAELRKAMSTWVTTAKPDSGSRRSLF